ncbi:hypothetical protein RKD30_000102 [Streptomyces pristinaespiralis]
MRPTARGGLRAGAAPAVGAAAAVTTGTYTEMLSRLTEPVLLGLAVLAVRGRGSAGPGPGRVPRRPVGTRGPGL